MKAIVLAAGFGTRLYPLTKDNPKALIEVGGKTLLDHLIDKLDSLDMIREIIIVTNRRFYGRLNQWTSQRTFKKSIVLRPNNISDPEERNGSVRDLFLGLQDKTNHADDFLVFCSDNYFDYPLSHFLLPCLAHPRSPFVAVYDLKDKSLASNYGVAQIDEHGKIMDFKEKPSKPDSSLISLGIYYLPREFKLRVFEYLRIDQLNPDRIGDFIGWLTQKETVYGHEFDGRWFDIGDKESLEEARRVLSVPAAGAKDEGGSQK